MSFLIPKIENMEVQRQKCEDLPAILGPSVSDTDVTLKDFSLGFLQEEGIEVILDGVEVVAGNVRDSRQQDGTALDSVPAGDKSGVTGGQGVVPQTEQSTNFVPGDIFSDSGLGNLLVTREEIAKSHVQLSRRSRSGYRGACHSGNDRSRRSEGRHARSVEGAGNGGSSKDGSASELHFGLKLFSVDDNDQNGNGKL